MTRILSIGAELDLATNNVNWGEEYNVKDYGVVFLHLLRLDQLVGDGYVIDVEGAEGASLPSEGDVAQLLETGGDVVATLPTRSFLSYTPEHRRTSSLSLTNWIPAPVELNNEKGESIDEESINEAWNWYFDSNFPWEVLISAGDDAYSQNNICKSLPIIKNSYDETLATQLGFGTQTDSDLEIWPGSIYLVPLLNDWSYDDFCRNVLNRVLSEEVELRDDTTPEWVNEFQVPGEQKQEQRIMELQSEIENLQQMLGEKREELNNVQEFKRLLYDSGTSLEDIVHRTLREIGLEVEGERPHRRDGAILLDEINIILEIHGTTGGIPRSKCEQLDTWVSDNQREDPTGSYKGLFIVNPFRKEKPDGRSGYLDSDTEAYMRNRGHKILTTDDLFHMLVSYKQGDASTKEIRAILASEETVLEFDGDAL